MLRRSHWQRLEGGAELFHGHEACDRRGFSRELLEVTPQGEGVNGFAPVQENLIATHFAGCARGMHYQVPPYAQAKLVTVIKGSAQFFWISFQDAEATPKVHSMILTPCAVSLYTPADCLHGFLAIDDMTEFLLKTSAPISIACRGEVNFLSKSLKFDFAVPLRHDLLSQRDRNAPEWEMRRRATTA